LAIGDIAGKGYVKVHLL